MSKKNQKKPLLTLSHISFFEKYHRDLNITDQKIQEQILDFLDSQPEVRLVIFDNLSCLLRIREDKADDWRESFLPFLIACRRRGVAVILTHHANKGGDQRGTIAREDQLDTSIMLRPLAHDHNSGAHFKVEFTKSRGTYGETVEPFTAKLIRKEGSLFEWAIGDPEKNVRSRLLRLIQDNGGDGLTVKEAAEELEVTPGAVSKAKTQLIKDGEITCGKRMRMA